MKTALFRLLSFGMISIAVLAACSQGSNEPIAQNSNETVNSDTKTPGLDDAIKTANVDDEKKAEDADNPKKDAEMEPAELNPGLKTPVLGTGLVVAEKKTYIGGLKGPVTVTQYCQETYDACDKDAATILEKNVCTSNFLTCTQTGNCQVEKTVCLMNPKPDVDCSENAIICNLTKQCRELEDDCLAPHGETTLCKSQFNTCTSSIAPHLEQCEQDRLKCTNLYDSSVCTSKYEACIKKL